MKWCNFCNMVNTGEQAGAPEGASEYYFRKIFSIEIISIWWHLSQYLVFRCHVRFFEKSETNHICIFCIKQKINLSLHWDINSLSRSFKFRTSTKYHVKVNVSMLNPSRKAQIQINYFFKSDTADSLVFVHCFSTNFVKFLEGLTLTRFTILNSYGKWRRANVL